MHDVRTSGSFIRQESGEEFMVCIIPSIQFLIAESVIGLPENNEFSIEVSLNGVDFSYDNVKFKFIENNQTNSPNLNVGPETGGTIINLGVIDFPTVNNRIQGSRCIFPGYEDLTDEEDNNPGIVQAQFIQNEEI